MSYSRLRLELAFSCRFQTAVQCSNVAFQIQRGVFAFVLQNVARMIERDNPVEEILLLVQPAQVRFVRQCCSRITNAIALPCHNV